MRPSTVHNLKQKYSLSRDSGFDNESSVRGLLHHLDEHGHLFGISCEYFSKVIILSHHGLVFPLANQRNGWGREDAPIAKVDAADCNNVLYSVGSYKGYEELNEPSFIAKLHEEVDSFNQILKGSFNADDLEGNLLEPTKNGFKAPHNSLVAMILINDIALPDM